MSISTSKKPRRLAAALASLVGLVAAEANAQSCPDTIMIQGYTPSAYPARICKNLRYGMHSAPLVGDTQRLDIILPSHKPGPYPVIVWIHGGGFAGGNRRLDVNGDNVIDAEGVHPQQEDSLGVIRQVLRGFAVVSVDYRLATQFNDGTPACPLPPSPPIGTSHFPIPLYDVKQAIRWVKARGSTYDLQTSSIALWGGSAGAHLAALAGATAATTPKYFEPTQFGTRYDDLRYQTSTTGLTIAFAGPHDLTQNMYYVSDIQPPPPPEDPRWIGAVCADIAVNNYLACDMPGGSNMSSRFGPCSNSTPSSWGGPPGVPLRLAASPIHYLTGPPVYLAHSRNDLIVNFKHSEAYHEELVKAGRPAALRVLPDSASHASGNPADFRDYCDADGCVSLEIDYLLWAFANGPQP